MWKEALTGLTSHPESLVGKLDWVTKRWLFARFVEQEKISWTDPWMKAQDLEFHHVDPNRSLGLAMAQTPPLWEISAKEILEATRVAPVDTRAHARSRLMHLLKQHPIRYFVDWEVIDAEGFSSLNLLNPFDAEPEEAEVWFRQLSKG